MAILLCFNFYLKKLSEKIRFQLIFSFLFLSLKLNFLKGYTIQWTNRCREYRYEKSARIPTIYLIKPFVFKLLLQKEQKAHMVIIYYKQKFLGIKINNETFFKKKQLISTLFHLLFQVVLNWKILINVYSSWKQENATT